MHDESVQGKMDVFVLPGLLLPWGQSDGSMLLAHREKACVVSQGKGKDICSGRQEPENVPVIKSPFVTIMKITEINTGFLMKKISIVEQH